MDSFFAISEQLVSFFLMMLVGNLAARRRIISKEFVNGLGTLIVKLLLPVMVFSNMINTSSRHQLFSDFTFFPMALLMYLLLIMLSAVLAKLMRLPKAQGEVFRALFVCGNIGFIGLPLILEISPRHGTVYFSLMNIVDQAVMWTYIQYMTTPSDKKNSFSVKNFLNPGLGAIFLSLLCVILEIPFPKSIKEGFLTIGNAATPLSLMYIGGLLYFSNWRWVLRRKDLYVGIGVKMLLFPIAYYTLVSCVVQNTDMTHAIAVAASMPPATAIAMFAQAKGKEGDYALGVVLAATVASLLTVSLVAFVLFR